MSKSRLLPMKQHHHHQCPRGAKRTRLGNSLSYAINPLYKDSDFVAKFRKDLEEKRPFPHWQLPNFLQVEPSLIENVEKELIRYSKWSRKENDLYSLHQTPDLRSINERKYPSVYAFWRFLNMEMKIWLQNTSGIELLPRVDSTGSCYAATDCLLPHTDQVDERRFAFVYYLTEEPWNETFGGQTHVYNSDHNCLPTTVFDSFLPTRNSLLLFEVSARSWHSVAEVIGEEHAPRLSINGWYHTIRKIDTHKSVMPTLHTFLPTNEINFSEIFAGPIVDSDGRKKMRAAFTNAHDLLVKDAFQETFSKEVLEQLAALEWEEKGPVNKRWIAELELGALCNEGPITKLTEALRSQTMISFVEELTGLQYKEPLFLMHVYRLTRGCYTMAGDEDAEKFYRDGASTDFWLYFGKEQWEEEAGGEVVYIRRNVIKPVLHCPPTIGAVAMIRRDRDVFPFLKYVNSRAKLTPIYVISFSVYGGSHPKCGSDENRLDDGDNSEDDQGSETPCKLDTDEGETDEYLSSSDSDVSEKFGDGNDADVVVVDLEDSNDVMEDGSNDVVEVDSNDVVEVDIESTGDVVDSDTRRGGNVTEVTNENSSELVEVSVGNSKVDDVKE